MTKPPDLVHAILAMCESTAAHGARVRVGLDVVSVTWFARQLGATDDTAFVRTAFTSTERDYCAGRPERFAVRWAAKEAVAKAIGTGFRGLRPCDIEIVHHPDGRPEVRAAAGTIWPQRAQAWAWELTLCHEGDAALAVAVTTGLDAPWSPQPAPSLCEIPTRTESQTGQTS